MLKLFAILIPLASFANSAFAVDVTMKKELEKLDPSERMEQACDAALKRIQEDFRRVILAEKPDAKLPF